MFFVKGWSFSCSLEVLYGGLGISELQFLSKIYSPFFQLHIFFNLNIKTLDLDLDWYSAKYPDSDLINPDTKKKLWLIYKKK